MQTLTITRVLAGARRGSSWPLLVETEDGQRVAKLHGAAQGSGALVAEVIVAALAEALGLRVPARCLLVLAPDTPRDDRDQELGDLLAASLGLNLGFAVLEGARDVAADDLAALDTAESAAILWLDRLVLNPDRTHRNTNLLVWHEQLWLIDHGASLRFQYDWPAVTESTPRETGSTAEPHLFESAAQSSEWTTWDGVFASNLTREVLEAAVAEVPDTFLLPLLPRVAAPPTSAEDALRRRRAAYAAFLWKRLQPPRDFAHAAPTRPKPNARGRPSWLTEG